jgi:hypothetical protein
MVDMVEQLLAFPDAHPYAKWWGTHWRLVEIADAGLDLPVERLRPGVAQELAWLLPALNKVVITNGRVRRHASMEGNAVFALSRLGFADHPGTGRLVSGLLSWQWDDGGWNCDQHPGAVRSSFHESVTPALGLAAYAQVTGNSDARAAAEGAAALLLRHRLFRSIGKGEEIHPSWLTLHYPAYWHYDILQGLRLLQQLDLLDDPRAGEALDLIEKAQRQPARFSGRTWASARQPAAVDWGRSPDNPMLNKLADGVLRAAGR